ncbi:MAG: hypothetical protein CMN76_06910 [Spirochaetaceae bacterium]|nr:hypothetical protein [Spirochaetaceae bacterium]|tara:strand:+ start:48989 stop:49753 length:765 start_codon:yes stop_codon:yes gene_type:complete
MLLIVGAFPPETDSLETLVGPGIQVQSVGIGPVEATLGLEALITEFAPTEVLFLGSCGQYAGSPPAEYIFSQVFTLLDPNSLLGRSRMVPAMRKFSAPTPGSLGLSCKESGQFQPSIVNTTVALSLESHGLSLPILEQAIEGLETHLARKSPLEGLRTNDVPKGPMEAEAQVANGSEAESTGRGLQKESIPVVENLEVFGMARLCEIHKIGFSTVMAVTNAVGPEGSASWAENYRPMGQTLQEKVSALVEKWRG